MKWWCIFMSNYRSTRFEAPDVIKFGQKLPKKLILPSPSKPSKNKTPSGPILTETAAPINRTFLFCRRFHSLLCELWGFHGLDSNNSNKLLFAQTLGYLISIRSVRSRWGRPRVAGWLGSPTFPIRRINFVIPHDKRKYRLHLSLLYELPLTKIK